MGSFLAMRKDIILPVSTSIKSLEDHKAFLIFGVMDSRWEKQGAKIIKNEYGIQAYVFIPKLLQLNFGYLVRGET